MASYTGVWFLLTSIMAKVGGVRRLCARRLAMVFLAGMVLLPAEGWSAPTETVRIGVLAKRGAEVTLQRWQPTAEYLSRNIPEYRFEIVPLDFEQVFPAAGQQMVDFILSNSAFYVVLESEFGAFRIASLKTTAKVGVHSRFGGVIFTRVEHSDINTLKDVRGRRFMGVKSTSLGGYMAAVREFHEVGIEPADDFSTLEFGGTHDAVVYAVRDGEVDVGTVRTDTLERMSEEGRIELSQFKLIRSALAPAEESFPFLISTRLYPEWPMAALPHVAPTLVQQVTVKLLAMPPDSSAAMAANAVGWSVPANYQPVHELLQELHLRPYAYLDEIEHLRWMVEHPELFALLAVMLMVWVGYTSRVARLNRRLETSEAKLRGSLEQLETARNQLIQSEKMAAIGQLSAGVAHEINNPIGYVYSNLNTLEHYAADLLSYHDAFREVSEQLPETERERIVALDKRLDIAYLQDDMKALIAESREGVERVRKIVADLKDFARHDRGEWDKVDINTLIDSALNIVHNELKYKAEVVRELGELPKVYCVAGQVEQVFVNLLVNASQAISEKGTITVRSGVQDEGQVWVEVEDDGEGIPEENREQLFDPFFTTKPVGQGTGLGLSISYGIIQNHGGEVGVKSTEGEGSRFRVVLPVAGPPEESERKEV